MSSSPGERPRFQEDWLVAVLDSLSEGVIALARDGRIVAANPAAERLLGFRIADHRYDPWNALSWRELVTEDEMSLTGSDHPIAATLRDGEPREGTIVGLVDAGPVRWLALATHVLSADDPSSAEGVVVSFQDQTDRVRVEHELQRLVDVLREFIASVTHDLRSPLTAVLGHAKMLAAGWEDMEADERDRSLASIVRQAEALGRLVDDLSVVTRLESGGISLDPREVPVRELVELALDGLAELEGIEVDVPRDATVVIDPEHGRRMLVNLVHNAAKYGGTPIAIASTEVEDGTEISVSDRGPGVPEEFVPRLFERFTRASDIASHAGTGLGLAIVAGLAQMNGGDVRYEPNEPQGARFVLRLPTS